MTNASASNVRNRKASMKATTIDSMVSRVLSGCFGGAFTAPAGAVGESFFPVFMVAVSCLSLVNIANSRKFGNADLGLPAPHLNPPFAAGKVHQQRFSQEHVAGERGVL